MMHRLSLGLLASAISIASLPAIAQEDGSADDLGVMSVSLKDVVKPTIGFQGALQGALTPNQAGIGGFLPLFVGTNPKTAPSPARRCGGLLRRQRRGAAAACRLPARVRAVGRPGAAPGLESERLGESVWLTVGHNT